MQLGRAHRLQAEARAQHRAAKESWIAEQARKAEEAEREIKAGRDAREKAREQVASAEGGGGGWEQRAAGSRGVANEEAGKWHGCALSLDLILASAGVRNRRCDAGGGTCRAGARTRREEGGSAGGSFVRNVGRRGEEEEIREINVKRKGCLAVAWHGERRSDRDACSRRPRPATTAPL